jgi:phytoene dehydrogenase-like protein
VPNGFTDDAEPAILDQLERFAPGLRDRIVARAARPTAQIAAENENYIGGDIIGGANTPWQVIARPRLATDPYDTGIPGVFICSAATPPGAGVHGMNGYNAAQSVLRWLRRRP